MPVLEKIKVAIIGATGFSGLDLVLMLSKHPKVKITYLCATKNLGRKISFFDKRIKKNLPKISSVAKINWKIVDLVFLSLPNGEAQKVIKKTFNKYIKLKYIDLSADFRITDTKIYDKNYGIKHTTPNLIKYSNYSISEFSKKKINKFRIIANPGCYPTSIQLALVPIIRKNLINLGDITIDSKSGYSGAGKNLERKFTHKNLYKSTFAYSIKNHKHICEMDQELYKMTKKRIKYSFNAHLIPTFRGILSSIYVHTKPRCTGNQLRNERGISQEKIDDSEFDINKMDDLPYFICNDTYFDYDDIDLNNVVKKIQNINPITRKEWWKLFENCEKRIDDFSEICGV